VAAAAGSYLYQEPPLPEPKIEITSRRRMRTNRRILLQCVISRGFLTASYRSAPPVTLECRRKR
jgi:hypothetical protein